MDISCDPPRLGKKLWVYTLARGLVFGANYSEQVGILWNELFNHYHLKIRFAHRTFAWSSEAQGKAAVHCVIIGFAAYDSDKKLLYDYETPRAEAHEVTVRNINPYLVEGEDFVILKRSKPLGNAPLMNYGSIAIDNGHLILTESDKIELLRSEPNAEKWIREYIGSEEFLNSRKRYCLWLMGISPAELRNLPKTFERVEATRKFRLGSDRQNTKELAATPYLFGENRQPNSKYLLVPKVSSETRRYLPLGYCEPYMIANGSSLVIPNATLYVFGVLSSTMHNEWMRYTAGRMKSDYQYSSSIVYNNFPWPQPTPAQIKNIEKSAEAILDARSQYPDSSLADLYDPIAMPKLLTDAHRTLDRAVDTAYRPRQFVNERNRIEFLFTLYQQLTAPLIGGTSTKKRVKAKAFEAKMPSEA